MPLKSPERNCLLLLLPITDGRIACCCCQRPCFDSLTSIVSFRQNGVGPEKKLCRRHSAEGTLGSSFRSDQILTSTHYDGRSFIPYGHLQSAGPLTSILQT